MSHELKSLQALHQLRTMQREQTQVRQQQAKQTLNILEQRITDLHADWSNADAWLTSRMHNAFDAAQLLLMNRYTDHQNQQMQKVVAEKQQVEIELTAIASQLMKAQLAIDQTEFRTDVVVRESRDAKQASEWSAADDWAATKAFLRKETALED